MGTSFADTSSCDLLSGTRVAADREGMTEGAWLAGGSLFTTNDAAEGSGFTEAEEVVLTTTDAMSHPP